MRAEGAAGLAPQIAGLNRKLFARLDGNQDNRVSLQEVKHSGILRKLGQAQSDEEEKQVFEKADTNRDGVLSRGESFAFFNGLMQGSAEALALITLLVGRDEDPATASKTVLKPPEEAEQADEGAEKDSKTANTTASSPAKDEDRLRTAAPAYDEALALAADAAAVARPEPKLGIDLAA